MKYTKKENADFKMIQTHLKVLEERTKRLKKIIRERKKKSYYNISDAKKLLKKVKKAKLSIGEAEYI